MEVRKEKEVKKTKFDYKKAFIITTVALILLGGLNIYSIMAQTTFTIPKPYTADLTPKVVFSIDSIIFAYNAATNQYSSCEVVVRNTDTVGSYAGTVEIYLYDATSTEIASGTQTFAAIAPSGTVTVTVTLSWVSGKTLANLDSGKVLVVAT